MPRQVAVMLLVGIVACSCASHAPIAPSATPNPPSAPDSAAALESQRTQYFHDWLDKANTAQKAFYNCVTDYAMSHQKAALTATELAGAAVSACGMELAEFRNDEHALYTLAEPNTAEADAQTDRAVTQVTDDGKGFVLRIVAERTK